MARNEEQNRKMRQNRLDRILSCAGRLFAVRGFSAVRISDIAAAAGMSHGLLYHYYKSKEEIFLEIVRSAFEKMNTAARELELMPQNPKEKLEAAAAAICRSLDLSEDFVWYSSLISIASLSDAIPKQVKELIERERDIPYQVIARIVEEGQKDGALREGAPMDLAVLFWTAVKGMALHKAALKDSFRIPDSSVLIGIFLK